MAGAVMTAPETNVFRPAVVAQSISTQLVPDPVTPSQYAQERFLATSTNTANPNFALTSDRNKLVENGGPISRGYIRRSDINVGDATSSYRLYFMFNPETIQRSYIAYLDQAALDPGNAVFGSNNMAAAPGIVQFTFELLFDRQLEVAQDPSHPGTKVDYDYFDIVVRGIVPDSTDTGNAIPDNGIMMVNPHNILVVFGEDLSVQGRVRDAAVNFEKFNNAMVPTRLRIQLNMMALYIGPVQTVPNYSLYSSEATSAATIPFEKTGVLTVTQESVQFAKVNAIQLATTNSPFVSGVVSPITGSGIVTGSTDMTTFAHHLLQSLNVPDNESNVQALIAWEQAEGGIVHNNPMNCTLDLPGATNWNSIGVKTYVSLDQGLQATVMMIVDHPGYPAIYNALKDGTSSCAVGKAVVYGLNVNGEAWGTSKLLLDILGC
jgi:hypothetical protein